MISRCTHTHACVLNAPVLARLPRHLQGASVCTGSPHRCKVSTLPRPLESRAVRPAPAVPSRLWSLCSCCPRFPCVSRAAGARTPGVVAQPHCEPGTLSGPHCDRVPGAVGTDTVLCACLVEAWRTVSVCPPCFDGFGSGPGCWLTGDSGSEPVGPLLLLLVCCQVPSTSPKAGSKGFPRQ